MSAFDDEFGLFGDEEKSEEEERKSTLGARRIVSDEPSHDDIEPEDERPRRSRGRDRSGESAGTYAPAEGAEPRRLLSRLRAGARTTSLRFGWETVAAQYRELLLQVWHDKMGCKL